ncbi:MAG: S1-like domain-containing RNA-binding protein [Chitinophagaceae bacterium]
MLLAQYNKLKIVRSTSVGMYLTDRSGNEVLLPNKYIKPHFKVDDIIEVFVYKDYEHRWIATTLKPYITLHHFASLKVKSVTDIGAFLDWGLEKDLFIPFKEQNQKMQVDFRYIVYLYIDEQTERLVCTSKLNRYLDNTDVQLAFNEEVKGIVFETTALGYNVIINQKHKGLLYHSEILKPLKIGDRIVAYVKQVREDGGIDLMQQPMGMQRLEAASEKILELLENHPKHFLPLTDLSTPEEIKQLTGQSKKTFKRSIGILWKLKKIDITTDGIQLQGAK